MHRLLRAFLSCALAIVAMRAISADDPLHTLRKSFGAAAFSAPHLFEYRLQVTDADGGTLTDARYRLDTGSGAVHRSSAGTEQWHDGQSGFAADARGLLLLDAKTESALAGQAASNFARLFADDATRVEPVADGMRVVPAGQEPFIVRLDPETGLVRENVFSDGIVARELDYREVDGMRWPMGFEVVDGDRVERRGRFSETRLAPHGPLPAIVVDATAELSLDAPDAGARLISPGLVATAANEYNLVTDAAGRTMVFARSAADFVDAKIFVATRATADAPWSTPEPAPFSDDRYSDSDPWLAPSGRALYFVSNRPRPGDTAPRKDTDLWQVAIDDGFGEPEWLGARVNSDAMELGVEVHDGSLYFNSSRPDGPARLSIYRASLDGDDAPRALDGEVNAGELQGDFTIAPNGRTALFWSVRDGGDGDLYRATKQGDGWVEVQRMPAPFSGPGFDFTPHFIDAGRAVAFATMRTTTLARKGLDVLDGQANLYVAKLP